MRLWLAILEFLGAILVFVPEVLSVAWTSTLLIGRGALTWLLAGAGPFILALAPLFMSYRLLRTLRKQLREIEEAKRLSGAVSADVAEPRANPTD